MRTFYCNKLFFRFVTGVCVNFFSCEVQQMNASIFCPSNYSNSFNSTLAVVLFVDFLQFEQTREDEHCRWLCKFLNGKKRSANV